VPRRARHALHPVPSRRRGWARPADAVVHVGQAGRAQALVPPDVPDPRGQALHAAGDDVVHEGALGTLAEAGRQVEHEGHRWR